MTDSTPEKTDLRGAEPGKFGQDAHVYDERIATIAAIATTTGLGQVATASLCRISVATLRKYYKADMDSGREVLLGRVMSQVYSDALKPGATKSQQLVLDYLFRLRNPNHEKPEEVARPTPHTDEPQQPMLIRFVDVGSPIVSTSVDVK